MQLRLSHKNKMQFHQNFIPKTNWQNLSRYLSQVLFKKSCLVYRHMLWEESGAFSNSDSFKYQPMRDITSVSMVKIATYNDWDIRTGLFEMQRVSQSYSKTRSKKHFRSLVIILGHFSNSWILKAFLTSKWSILTSVIIIIFSWFAEDTLDMTYQFENESKLCFIWSWRGKRSFWKNWPWIRCWKYNCREFWFISISTVLRSYSQLWSSLENGRYDATCYWCDLTNREKSWTGDKTENFISVASWRCSRTVFHNFSH